MNWEALFAVTLSAVLIFFILKIGMKPTWAILKTGVHRLIEGPQSPFPRKVSCFIQHEIAASELNYYGEIKSESVAEHLDQCRKFALRQRDTEWRAVPASYFQMEHMGAALMTPTGHMPSVGPRPVPPRPPSPWREDTGPKETAQVTIQMLEELKKSIATLGTSVMDQSSPSSRTEGSTSTETPTCTCEDQWTTLSGESGCVRCGKKMKR